MAKITMIDDLLLVKSAMLIGKTGPHFHCLYIAAILFMLPAVKCHGSPLPDINSTAADFWHPLRRLTLTFHSQSGLTCETLYTYHLTTGHPEALTLVLLLATRAALTTGEFRNLRISDTKIHHRVWACMLTSLREEYFTSEYRLELCSLDFTHMFTQWARWPVCLLCKAMIFSWFFTIDFEPLHQLRAN